MTHQALISADAGLLILADGEDRFRLFDRAGSELETLREEEFFALARTVSDGRSVQVATVEEGVRLLDADWRASRCTRLYLMLLDPTEADKGLERIADAAESLAEYPGTRDYVRGTLSLTPLAPELRLERLQSFCAGRPRIGEITARLVATQDAIAEVETALRGALDREGFDESDGLVLLASTIESGALVRIIDSYASGEGWDEAWDRMEGALRPFEASATIIEALRLEFEDRHDAPAGRAASAPKAWKDEARHDPVGGGAAAPARQRYPQRLAVTIQDLMKAGAHYGHDMARWNPKMKPYLFGTRDRIHIIDLSQTVRLLAKALDFVSATAANGGDILFVGTKRAAQKPIGQAAAEAGAHFINHRWLGGTLTNWRTIRRSLERLRELDELLAGDLEGRKKKELRLLERRRDKLAVSIGGLRNLRNIPDLLFVVDTNKEQLAIREANLLGIPVIAILDSNSSPDGIAFPVPANDDSAKAIRLYCEAMVAAIDRGRLGRGAAPAARTAQPGFA